MSQVRVISLPDAASIVLRYLGMNGFVVLVTQVHEWNDLEDLIGDKAAADFDAWKLVQFDSYAGLREFLAKSKRCCDAIGFEDYEFRYEQ